MSSSWGARIGKQDISPPPGKKAVWKVTVVAHQVRPCVGLFSAGLASSLRPISACLVLVAKTNQLGHHWLPKSGCAIVLWLCLLIY